MRRIVAEPRHLRNVGRLSITVSALSATPFVSTASRTISLRG
jgi:hypothetical protein